MSIGLSLVFSYVFALMALVGMVYALHVNDDAQHVAALTYAGSALGITFAGDFLSLFLFWELTAVSAALLVWLRRDRAAVAAGFRYLLVHVFGGLCLLGGIVLYWSQSGSLAFGDMSPHAGTAAFALILIAFLLNAAVPPLGAWLPDAYPEATVTGAVFLTAFTTKSAVYALIRGFAGTELLVWWGAAMAVYGVVYAVLENDARRLLAYHIISQVGYMVCGVGLGTELALNGTTAHAFAHILYKAVLFMGAGAVLEVTGRRKLSEMGGLYKTMPVTLCLYMIGAFAISAVPLFSGFVSKSMVVSAAGESHRAAIFLTLTLASAGTFLHTGLKLPYYMFFGKDRGLARSRAAVEHARGDGSGRSGVHPHRCLSRRCCTRSCRIHVEYAPYTVRHVLATLGLLSFTALGFFVLLKHLDPEPDDQSRHGLVLPAGSVDGHGLRVSSRSPAWRTCSRQAYEGFIRRPLLGAAARLRQVDASVVDRAAEGIGNITDAVSQSLRMAVTGHAQYYGLIMAAGVLMAIAIAVFAR